jgi:hypothetical protein
MSYDMDISDNSRVWEKEGIQQEKGFIAAVGDQGMQEPTSTTDVHRMKRADGFRKNF